MAEWVRREHGKGAIDRAARALLDWWTSVDDDMPDDAWIASYRLVKNWRLCHALPLNVIQAGLRGRIRRMGLKDVIVAQRLKRFSSIMKKLVREPTMEFTQMHDLGGCRAILPDVASVRTLFEMYHGQPPLLLEGNSSIKPYDYINKPKSDGYRGIHIAVRYHPRKPRDCLGMAKGSKFNFARTCNTHLPQR